MGVEEEAAAARTGRVMAAESVRLARPVLGVVEEARDLAVRALERTMHFRRLAQIAAIRLVEEAPVGELAARAHCAAVVLIALAALLQRRLVGPRGSRTA